MKTKCSGKQGLKTDNRYMDYNNLQWWPQNTSRQRAAGKWKYYHHGPRRIWNLPNYIIQDSPGEVRHSDLKEGRQDGQRKPTAVIG